MYTALFASSGDRTPAGMPWSNRAGLNGKPRCVYPETPSGRRDLRQKKSAHLLGIAAEHAATEGEAELPVCGVSDPADGIGSFVMRPASYVFNGLYQDSGREPVDGPGVCRPITL